MLWGCRQPGRHGRPWSPAALVGKSVGLELTTTSRHRRLLSATRRMSSRGRGTYTAGLKTSIFRATFDDLMFEWFCLKCVFLHKNAPNCTDLRPCLQKFPVVIRPVLHNWGGDKPAPPRSASTVPLFQSFCAADSGDTGKWGRRVWSRHDITSSFTWQPQNYIATIEI